MIKVNVFVLMGIFLFINYGCFRDQVKKESNEVSSCVDPFIGSEKGNIFPGACLPFGMVKLGPDVVPPNVTNGYRDDRDIAGFSHNHTSGTGGGPRYGNIMVIPQAGKVDLKEYVSLKKVNEFAAPGYYRVRLARQPGDVECEITATHKTGFHKYRFFTWGGEEKFQANILIDVSHTNTRGGSANTRCLSAEAEDRKSVV